MAKKQATKKRGKRNVRVKTLAKPEKQLTGDELKAVEGGGLAKALAPSVETIITCDSTTAFSEPCQSALDKL